MKARRQATKPLFRVPDPHLKDPHVRRLYEAIEKAQADYTPREMAAALYSWMTAHRAADEVIHGEEIATVKGGDAVLYPEEEAMAVALLTMLNVALDGLTFAESYDTINTLRAHPNVRAWKEHGALYFEIGNVQRHGRPERLRGAQHRPERLRGNRARA